MARLSDYFKAEVRRALEPRVAANMLDTASARVMVVAKRFAGSSYEFNVRASRRNDGPTA